jgi:tetratricopeptide (TPR) repeat protein
VRRAGNKVRITAQLIDVPTESHLWAEKYDRELDDIFSIQDDISGKIAHALQVKLVYTQEPGRKQTESMEAYTLYLKGRYFWNKRNKDSVLNSLNLFEEAIAIDPNYARAYSGMADAYYVAAIYDFMERGEGLAKAREAATKALQLDETLAEAHASLGINLFDNLEYEEAKREFRRAIELNPAYATARQWYSYSLMEWGDKDLAIEEIRKAHELDPLSQVITVALADEITSGGRVDEAMAVLDALLRSSAGYAVAYQYRSTCFALKRMKEEAFADLESGYKLDGDEAKFTVGLAWLSGWFGEEERALRILQEVTQVKGRPPRYPADVALCYAVLGKRDEFFAWVDRAIDMKWFSVWGLRYDPFYDKVRDDPRFPEIFRKLGLPY